MPKINGIEFLGILKSDDYLKYILQLYWQHLTADLLECYRIGIAGYLLKPLKYDEYVDRLQNWLNIGVQMS
jgi:response regulator of citrate/malate metabolism